MCLVLRMRNRTQMAVRAVINTCFYMGVGVFKANSLFHSTTIEFQADRDSTGRPRYSVPKTCMQKYNVAFQGPNPFKLPPAHDFLHKLLHQRGLATTSGPKAKPHELHVNIFQSPYVSRKQPAEPCPSSPTRYNEAICTLD